MQIREKTSKATLAEGNPPDEVISYEGNLYFHPEKIATSALAITPRTYTCPYKGTCHWVDFTGPDGRVVKDVAWVYAEPKPGHEQIKGRYGFYAGTRGATEQVG